MAVKRITNYSKGMVIVHGKSEKVMVNHIISNLHLNMKVDGKNGGKNSLELTSICSFLKKGMYKSKSDLCRELDIEENNGTLVDFKIFIIMDVDRYDSYKAAFLSKEMFGSHWLRPYIVPILNDPTLESALKKAGIITKDIPNKDKTKEYTKVFPIQGKGLDSNQVNFLLKKLKGVKETNLDIFLKYCLDHTVQYK